MPISPSVTQPPTQRRSVGVSIALIIVLMALGGALVFLLSDSQSTPINTPTTKTYATPSLQEQLTNQTGIKEFADYDQMREYLLNTQAAANNGVMMNDITTRAAVPMMAMQESATADAAGSTVATGMGADTKEYSTTNIQVAGVDEADIVKSDGSYLYIASANTVYIVPADDQLTILSTIELESTPQELYIADNRLVVFGYDNQLYQRLQTRAVPYILPYSSYTFFHIYDTRDKANPTLLSDLSFEGSYQQSRLIGDYVYFITTNYHHYLTDIPIPRLLQNDQPVCTDETPNGTTCPRVFYFDIPRSTTQLTTVSAINIQNTQETVNRNIYALNGASTIYASPTALYLTYPIYFDEYQFILEVTREIVTPRLTQSELNRIGKIEAADPQVLTQIEKTQKINQIIQAHLTLLPPTEQEALNDQINQAAKQRYQQLAPTISQTVVHKLALDGANVTHTAESTVPGTVLNQFSMDEHDGYFRIATTNNQTFSQFVEQQTESYNNVFVLNSDLDIIGSIKKIAVGERIYAARFMQNRAYLVTFVQVDPLFVIDLSEPTMPRILGELKIPGFSNYLHPYDDQTLIGIGQETTVNEFGAVRQQGVKISLFDVADVHNPAELDTYTVSEQNSTSLAQYDHKAVLFDYDKQLLVVPVSAWNEKSMNAAFVFSVSREQGLSFRGSIAHDTTTNNSYSYQQQIKRSLYIGNTLYTVSDEQLKASDLNTLEQIDSLRFPNPQYPITPYPIDDVMPMMLEQTEPASTPAAPVRMELMY